MQFLKGLVAVSGTVLALLTATIVFAFLKTRGGPDYPPGTEVGWDLKVLWIVTIHSPIYWLVVLTLLGLSAWVFGAGFSSTSSTNATGAGTLSLLPHFLKERGRLRAAGLRIITIANFSPIMLRANADNAGITNLFDDLVSTEVNGTFKPDPEAYQLGMKRLHLQKDEIVFAAFGGWDAYGAETFGYATVWVNRFNLPTEKLGRAADRTSTNMDGLVEFVLGSAALRGRCTSE